MNVQQLREKQVFQIESGVCLGRIDDILFDPASARLEAVVLWGRPRLLGLLGREPSLTIPWAEIDRIGEDAVLVRTALPEGLPRRGKGRLWQWLGL